MRPQQVEVFESRVKEILAAGLVVPSVCGPVAGIRRQQVYELLAAGRMRWVGVAGVGMVSLADFCEVLTGDRPVIEVRFKPSAVRTTCPVK